MQANYQSLAFENQFASVLFGETRVSESDNPLDSIWSKSLVTGWRKKMGAGVSASVGYAFNREKLGLTVPPPFTFQRVYIPAITLMLDMDLWKNAFGNLDSDKSKSLALRMKRANLGEQLARHRLAITARSLYWALVFAEQKITIAGDILQNVEKSLREVRSRKRDSLADSGDVASMSANAARAQANVSAARYARRQIAGDIAALIPEIDPKTIKITKVPSLIHNVIELSKRCSAKILQKRQAPLQFSRSDDLARLVSENFEQDKKISERDDDATLKLRLEGQSFGFDNEAATAIEQPFAAEERKYIASLQLNVPLGNFTQTKQQKIQLQKTAAEVETSELLAKLNAEHARFSHSYPALQEALEYYDRAVASQQSAYRSAVRKYKQGRLSVLDYIGEQNKLLEYKVSALDSELQLVLMTLAYLSIFDSSPCSLIKV